MTRNPELTDKNSDRDNYRTYHVQEMQLSFAKSTNYWLKSVTFLPKPDSTVIYWTLYKLPSLILILILPTFKRKCISDVVRINSWISFHLSKLSDAKCSSSGQRLVYSHACLSTLWKSTVITCHSFAGKEKPHRLKRMVLAPGSVTSPVMWNSRSVKLYLNQQRPWLTENLCKKENSCHMGIVMTNFHR